MEEKTVIRVKPRTFEDGWREDFLSVGVTIPEDIPTLAYAPVNHTPMPFSVDVDVRRRRIVKRTVGVIPNVAYKGHIYSWDEFCELMKERQDDLLGI